MKEQRNETVGKQLIMPLSLSFFFILVLVKGGIGSQFKN